MRNFNFFYGVFFDLYTYRVVNNCVNLADNAFLPLDMFNILCVIDSIAFLENSVVYAVMHIVYQSVMHILCLMLDHLPVDILYLCFGCTG